MKKIILFSFVVVFFLSGCVGDEGLSTIPTLDATLLYQTAASLLTQDADVVQEENPTSTITSVTMQTAIPTIDRTRSPIQSPTAEVPCNKALAGNPLDITIPDGTIMESGQIFSKTWRLVNGGSCTWTRLYAVTFFSGNPMNAIQTHYLLSEVPPGAVVDITIDMSAPENPGSYQSNWMLMDPNGELFGMGPNGDAPFWARIDVVMRSTATPQPNPSPTATHIVYMSGESEIASGQLFDLDSNTLNPDDNALVDFYYTYGGNPPYLLTNMNGTMWVAFGEEQPTYDQCVNAELVQVPLGFFEVPFGTYICYQTSESLHGWLLINGIMENKLAIRFLTWALP